MKVPGRTVLLPPMLIAVSVLVACFAAILGHVPPLLRALVPAAVALAVAQPLVAWAVAAERRLGAVASGRAATAEARAAALDRQASQLRHDLRGILSPAMLTADRLTTSQDPVARRAGEAMVSTVERAEERLRREQGPTRRLDRDSGPVPSGA